MELKNNKSAWAALATLGVTAVAAGATAFVKMRERRRRREQDGAVSSALSAEQLMVYNEAVSSFIALNDRLYELRRMRAALQPIAGWMATGGPQPDTTGADPAVQQLAADVARFMSRQVPFINACLSTVDSSGLTYADCVRGAVGGTFDATLDEEPTGVDTAEGTPIAYVLRLGYYFPDSSIAPNPVKSVVAV